MYFYAFTDKFHAKSVKMAVACITRSETGWFAQKQRFCYDFDFLVMAD
jgi:hypothetical protein